MEDPDFLVETLTAQHPNGTRSEIVIRLGRPAPLAETSGTYVCRLRMERVPEWDNLEDLLVHGVGPLQALHLAMVAIRADLELFEEEAGATIVCPDTGAPLDWRRFWFHHPA